MNEQVIKEAEELIDKMSGYTLDDCVSNAIKTQERVISEFEKAINQHKMPDYTMLCCEKLINHNKDILNHLKTLI